MSACVVSICAQRRARQTAPRSRRPSAPRPVLPRSAPPSAAAAILEPPRGAFRLIGTRGMRHDATRHETLSPEMDRPHQSGAERRRLWRRLLAGAPEHLEPVSGWRGR
ncbi:hypothetical protein PLESTB_000780000 [Pleodorina starrii]|uniref:Uncharacterized protein n=1 Tax=Pleodorina starrii TaxID=330485 RepID=A0A9W6BKF0_9CHLO|nr:hypothetical protein PLESTB_000780000 [Pleodorina starrii]GLC72902.1 hypothetical protein PLESTF_001307900 [Pleodorina starrii]